MISMADEDGDGMVDQDEFLELIRVMRTGNPHEGPIAPKVVPVGDGGGGCQASSICLLTLHFSAVNVLVDAHTCICIRKHCRQ